MSEAHEAPPLRVEQALRLVPPIESLAPLRALLLAASRPDEDRMWSSSASYLTLGKRGVVPAELRSRLDAVLQGIRNHLARQFDAAITALDAYQRGERAEAVDALLAAGASEERPCRLATARAWYAVALEIAEGLSGRRPEIDVLLAVAGIDRRCGAFGEAARRYQRCLALAEAESDHEGGLSACLALGEIALALGNFPGARAWYTRALQQAQAVDHRVMVGRVHGQFALLTLREGDLGATPELLRRARTCFRPDDDAAELARLLRTQGMLHELLGDRSAAADYREALMWALRTTNAPELEASIRLHLAKFHVQGDRLLEAEEEMRRAEELAVRENLASWLVRVYIQMGEARAHARDENGFVFFEQAIELCRTLECATLLEASAYRAYGDFREALGEEEAAHACFERAAEILAPLGTTADPSVLSVSALL